MRSIQRGQRSRRREPVRHRGRSSERASGQSQLTVNRSRMQLLRSPLLRGDDGRVGLPALVQRFSLQDIGHRIMQALSTLVSIPPGQQYTVSAGDVVSGNPLVTVAQSNGMHVDELLQFNRDIPPVVAGSVLYVPSSDELLAMSFTRRYGLEVGLEEYAAMKDTDAATIVRAARGRASGERGAGYGKTSTESMTPNPALRRNRRVETRREGDSVEYVVDAGENWKCNVYMQDSMYEAGFDMPVNERHLYPLAGNIERYDDHFGVVDIGTAGPGRIVQLDAGNSTAASHNLVLVAPLDTVAAPTEEHPEALRVTMTTAGAEYDRAAISMRTYTVVPDADGYRVIEDHQPEPHWVGATLRFLEPVRTR